MILHFHNGIDSPKIKTEDIDGNLTTGDDEVKLTGDQSVAGVKTFSDIPVLPASNPTTANQIARKAYADSFTQPTHTLVGSSDANDLIDHCTDEESTTSVNYIKKKDVLYNDEDGTITVTFEIWNPTNDGNVVGAIFVNDVLAGTERTTNQPDAQTYTEDIAVETGDHVQLYIKKTTGTSCYCDNFKLYYKKQLTITPGTINLD
jgi:hypothetical protein